MQECRFVNKFVALRNHGDIVEVRFCYEILNGVCYCVEDVVLIINLPIVLLVETRQFIWMDSLDKVDE